MRTPRFGHVGSVTCHQCHAMNFGGRRQNAVDYWQLASGVEPPPFIGNRAIDRQNAFAKGLIHCSKSGLNRFGLSRCPSGGFLSMPLRISPITSTLK